MPFKITNLMFSRRDPTKRGRGGHRHLNLKRGIVIGRKRIKVGRYLVLTDSEYELNKDAIDVYEGAGAVSVTQLWEPVQIPLYVPAPSSPPPIAEPEVKPSVEISIDDDTTVEDGAIVIDLKEETPEVEAEAEKPATSEPDKKEYSKPSTRKRAKRRKRSED
jgi:hypothetical protein